MKKILAVLAAVSMLLTAGCRTTSDLVESSPSPSPTVTPQVNPNDELGTQVDVKNTIPISGIIKMNNDWTIMGEYETEITEENKKDRIIMGTSAKSKNGEMQWDDSQYWTLAVIAENGAYNLFSQRMQGHLYFEYSEAFVKGISTPVITAYIFSGTDREIRNYIFDKEEKVFVEYPLYSTRSFSTGGINNLYSSFPEYKAK